MENDPKHFHKKRCLWWIRQVILIILGCFFLLFGIQVLVSSYKLEEPFSFILTFFASNFIILISATLLVVFVFQMRTFVIILRNRDKQQDDFDASKKSFDRD